jgi:hypothetical protein
MVDNSSLQRIYGRSVPYCDHLVKNHLDQFKPLHIVDFGAGGGKHGKIARQVLANNVYIIAIEGFKDTVQMLSSTGIYDEVHNLLIQDWLYSDSKKYDMAIFGDVLEHLKPKEIHKVIKCCIDKFRLIVIICPLHNIHDKEEYDNPLEDHQTYITNGFFDRYEWVEKHIIKKGEWNMMYILIQPDTRSMELFWKRLMKRLFTQVFHTSMLLLQPLGLAKPLADIVLRYIWFLRLPK